MDKETFVGIVCSGIRRKRVRSNVREELYDHIESKTDEMMQKEGITKEEAEQRTVSEMGDAQVLFRQYQALDQKYRAATALTLLFTILAVAGAATVILSFPPIALTGLAHEISQVYEGTRTTGLAAGVGLATVILLTLAFILMIPVSVKIGEIRIAKFLQTLNI